MLLLKRAETRFDKPIKWKVLSIFHSLFLDHKIHILGSLDIKWHIYGNVSYKHDSTFKEIASGNIPKKKLSGIAIQNYPNVFGDVDWRSWLSHFMTPVSFYTPCKHQRDQWHEMSWDVVLGICRLPVHTPLRAWPGLGFRSSWTNIAVTLGEWLDKPSRHLPGQS